MCRGSAQVRTSERRVVGSDVLSEHWPSQPTLPDDIERVRATQGEESFPRGQGQDLEYLATGLVVLVDGKRIVDVALLALRHARIVRPGPSLPGARVERFSPRGVWRRRARLGRCHRYPKWDTSDLVDGEALPGGLPGDSQSLSDFFDDQETSSTQHRAARDCQWDDCRPCHGGAVAAAASVD